jgi:hypothetical protein
MGVSVCFRCFSLETKYKNIHSYKLADILGVYCNGRGEQQEVLGRTNSPTFPT